MAATYRLQLHAGFTFADASAIVPYLAELGITHLYLSPVLQAAAGSMHGYDVVDPERVSSELGGEAGFEALVRAAKQHGLGILLDIVPNHMSIELRTAFGGAARPDESGLAAGTDNLWWRDVLENGPASYYACAFDVDWASTSDDRVLLPVLGERYGRALTSGALGVQRQDGAIQIRVHDKLYPASPRTLGPVIKAAAKRMDPEEKRHPELDFVGDALAALPSSHERGREARARRHRHRAVLLARLAELAKDDAVADAIHAELAAINADPLALDALLEGQNYRLAHWTVAGDQLTYRRFFDVATLVGLRMEDPDVLAAAHARIFQWLDDGTIDGVRVDHVDGLREPGAYLHALRERAPNAWIVVEKILGDGERLPASWPIEGTTGYEHAEVLGRLIVDRGEGPRLARIFEAYTGETFDPPAGRRAARLEVMSDALHSEIERVTELAVRACATSPFCRDYTRTEIRGALSQLLAGYRAYRTYFGDGPPDPADRARLAEAAAAAVIAGVDADLIAYLEAALALELPTPQAQELARIVQQVSGSIVAKGDEDTLAYRQVALASRCEVGADIAIFGAEPDEVHAHLAAIGPRALVASSTHDTKRSEDVRARIAAISELPGVWEQAVMAWRERAAHFWGHVEPDRVLEYLMWQTLVGAWPISSERARQYAEKASREARRRTSWRAPDEEFETARDAWVAGVLGDPVLAAELAGMAARLAPHGDANALALLALKLTVPGVPDLYQGTELHAPTLVDPDNRGIVDYDVRTRELRAISGLAAADVAGDLSKAKLWLTRRVLQLRRARPALFEGPYRPLTPTGPGARGVLAFARGDDLIVVVRRLSASVPLADTALELPAGDWADVLAERTVSGRVELSVLLDPLPVLLISRAAAHERERTADRPSK